MQIDETALEGGKPQDYGSGAACGAHKENLKWLRSCKFYFRWQVRRARWQVVAGFRVVLDALRE